ncbi:hypothetical protein NQ318_017590 [Aromia moschata]|uniref:Receptor ligand binding region domain-containing protein n=1 Tax=Aromia moschata TaxID=1265417 RepID=A0AAV8Z100_9CUCU|nr:hypothetical protein NQ318_017590 [Aromia moschata]
MTLWEKLKGTNGLLGLKMATCQLMTNLVLDVHQLPEMMKIYPSCSGALAPGLAADMHFLSDVIAFIGPACLFALEPVARLAAYWNTPIITGMGDQSVQYTVSGTLMRT